MFSFFKYLDLIVLYYSSLIFGFLFQKKNVQISISPNEGFSFDNPIGNKGTDLLQRDSLAQSIAYRISNTNSLDSSFALGISSEWGFGKSSFFDLIKRHLSNENRIIVEFNPWLNHGAKTITKDFFKTLSSAIKPNNSNLSTDFNRYAQILLDINNSELNKIISPIQNLFFSHKSAKEEFDFINETIKKTNIQIVIFIDDIDRLYNDEIIEVIKLIRNTANFANTFFVAAYDRNYIISALKKVNDYNSESFLEKIFQVEIALPQFENQIIQKRIYELIYKNLRDEDKQEFNDIMLKKKVGFETNIFYFNYLFTLRDVTRFANSFIIAYNFLKGEVVISDLLNLELLRTKYLGVYKLIFNNTDEYLDTETDKLGKYKFVLKREEIEIKKENKEGEFILKKYLEKNPEVAGVSLSQIETAIRIVNCVFPSYSSFINIRATSLLSVSNPSSFERYSHYRLLDKNLSEIDFSNARISEQEVFFERIKFWVQKGLRWELKARFESIKYYNDKTDFEKVVKAIFFLASIPSIGENDYSGYDFADLLNKIKNNNGQISSKFYSNPKEYLDFILSVFEKAPSHYAFECDFLYQVIDDHITYDFIIPKEKVEELRLLYFEKYLAETDLITNTTWKLFHSCDIVNHIHIGGGSYQLQRIKNPKAIKLYINYIKKGKLDDFLLNIIELEPFHSKNQYLISNIIVPIFGGYFEFEKFLLEFKVSDYKYLHEFFEFYKVLSEHDFKVYVEFEFNIIPVKKKE
jgi:hypothetical protein